MFDLKEQLKTWRASLRGTETMRPSDLDELEHHIHDAIAALTAKGLNDEEAFLVATHRVGDAHRLAGEFRKTNGNYVWAHRAFWMLSGYMLIRIAAGSVAAVASLGELLAAYAGGNGTLVGVASAGITIVAWLAIIAAFYRWSGSRRQTTRFFDKSRSSIVVIAIAVVIAPVIARAIELSSKAALSRVMTTLEFGQAYAMAALTSEVFPVLLLAILLLAIALRLRQTTTRELAT